MEEQQKLYTAWVTGVPGEKKEGEAEKELKIRQGGKLELNLMELD